VNLIDQFGRPRARKILESSFAQFQADRAVVGLARQVKDAEESLAGYEKAMTCDRGDFAEFSAMRRELSEGHTTSGDFQAISETGHIHARFPGPRRQTICHPAA